jgi:teichuronic acid biosynthesis glycosyltransferase TuaG
MIVSATVIMPYFKKKFFFKAAYHSVLNQTVKDIEIIVIYDDENFSELDYVKKIINNRKNTSLIVNNKNFGPGFSRNIGIKKAKGKYISFLDCDDVWKRNKLKFQINFMKKYNLDITYTSYSAINELGTKLYNVIIKKEMVYENFLKSCDIGLSTVVIKKSIFNHFKFSALKTKEDYLLWLQLSKSNFKFVGIKKILSYWRITKKSLSSNIFQKIRDSFVIYHYFEKQSFLKTIISIVVLSFFAFKKNKFLKL